MSSDLDKLAASFGDADATVDLSDTIAEAWLALLFFWALGLTVLYQFITRYVFNDSAAWTEEIARYLLIATVFVGAVIGVAKNNHIQVDFFYRFMPQGLSRSVSLLTDVLRVAFLASGQLPHVVADAKNGQLPNDHRQPAHEHRLRRGVAGVCIDDMAQPVGHVASLATRL
jgi:TRAP-type transport system small permease protein